MPSETSPPSEGSFRFQAVVQNLTSGNRAAARIAVELVGAALDLRIASQTRPFRSHSELDKSKYWIRTFGVKTTIRTSFDHLAAGKDLARVVGALNAKLAGRALWLLTGHRPSCGLHGRAAMPPSAQGEATGARRLRGKDRTFDKGRRLL